MSVMSEIDAWHLVTVGPQKGEYQLHEAQFGNGLHYLITPRCETSSGRAWLTTNAGQRQAHSWEKGCHTHFPGLYGYNAGDHRILRFADGSFRRFLNEETTQEREDDVTKGTVLTVRHLCNLDRKPSLHSTLARCCVSFNKDLEKTCDATREMKITGETQAKLDLNSATTCRIASAGLTVLKVQEVFSKPALEAYSTLEVSVRGEADLAALTTVVKANIAGLRQLDVNCPRMAKKDLESFFEAVVKSSFVTKVSLKVDSVDAVLELVSALVYFAHERGSVEVVFRDRSFRLHRQVDFVGRQKDFTMPSPTADDTTTTTNMIHFTFAKFISEPFLRARGMTFSLLIGNLLEASPAESQIPISDTYINAEGVEESENRWSNIDLKLVVVWINEYADDEVHKKLVAAKTPQYHISVLGRQFIEEHINSCKEPLKRCVSLLALAHFLDIPTLKCLLASVLVSASPDYGKGLHAEPQLTDF